MKAVSRYSIKSQTTPWRKGEYGKNWVTKERDREGYEELHLGKYASDCLYRCSSQPDDGTTQPGLA
jgi:hypothetical protein